MPPAATDARPQTRGPQRQPISSTPATTGQHAAVAQANADQARRASALDVLASRLNITAATLKNTLLQTVFRGANDSEFAALVIVANEYKLNPLTKEMYAFPQKGGGIVPLVSIDGWIRIMNEHPQYDGIEFTDIADNDGKLLAIEACIYRKDRSRPIRVTEYLDECKGTTGPWTKSPARMLRHRALIQCARIAFGFSGIYTEDDSEVGDVRLGGDLSPAPMRNVTPPAGQLTADPPHDRETGEIRDGAGQGGIPDIKTDAQGREIDPAAAKADEIIDRAGKLQLMGDYLAFAEEAQPHIDAMSDEDMAGACNAALRQARQRLTQGQG